MEVKRILHIVGSMNRGGVESVVMNYYRFIDKSKYQFDFLYFGYDECYYDEEISKLGGKIYRISNSSSSNLLRKSIDLFKLLKRNYSFHAIHFHQSFHNGMYALSAYLAKHNTRISHSHSSGDNEGNSLYVRLYKNVNRILISSFSIKFIACSDDSAKYLFPKVSEVSKLPNSVDVDYFSSIDDSVNFELRKNLLRENNTLVILQVGRLEIEKNHMFSIEVAKSLLNKNINFKMLFVGEGSLRKVLETKVRDNNLLSNISFLGNRSDIRELMHASDVLIQPSHHEGFPLVLVESQSAGITAVVSDSITKEVDLDVHKIIYNSIEDIETWTNTILDSKGLKELPKEERIKIINSKNFNIKNSVKLLELIYQ